MPLPFPHTTARARVIANARELERTSTRSAAYAQAFNEARKTYFSRHPEGLLPEWLAIKASMRRGADYAPNGEPLKANPAVRQVRAASRLYADFTGDAPGESVKVNIPDVRFKVGIIVGFVLQLSLDIGELKFAPNDRGGLPALTVSHDGGECVFVGGEYEPLADHLDAEGLDNPKITAIMYRTVRDGKVEHYKHAFATYARPALKVLDERNAKMIGGSFRFTERGFVDSRPR